MTYSFRTFLAFGLLVASCAASGAESSAPVRHAVHHNRLDFAKARALAPSMAPVVRPEPVLPETDGLSRHDEDCNYGCIDH